jgi:hypothetical protein
MRLLIALLLICFSLNSVYSDSINTVNSTRSCMFPTTRDLTAASGNTVHTGCGFKPNTCVGFGSVGGSTAYTTFIGLSNNIATNRTLSSNAGFPTFGAAFFAFYDAGGGNVQIASINSYDDDGITLAWTKIGSPTGTVTYAILCWK